MNEPLETLTFNFSGLSQQVKDILIIGINSETIPLGEIIKNINDSDKKIFQEFFEDICVQQGISPKLVLKPLKLLGL